MICRPPLAVSLRSGGVANDGFEHLIDEINAIKADAHNSNAFLLEDAIVMDRRVMSIEDRLSKLERRSGN